MEYLLTNTLLLQCRRYGKILKDMDFSVKLRGVQTSAAAVYDALVNSINTVYDDVVQHGSIRSRNTVEYELFHNPKSLVDGPW